MLQVREVFQAKYGKGDELVALFKEIAAHWQAGGQPVKMHDFHVLTDASGPFFTVVTEYILDDFAAFDKFTAAEFASPLFAGWFDRMSAVTESGRREFYHVAA